MENEIKSKVSSLTSLQALHSLVHGDRKIALSILDDLLSKRSIISYEKRKGGKSSKLGALIENGIDLGLIESLFEKQKHLPLPDGAAESMEGIVDSLCDGVELPNDDFGKLCKIIQCYVIDGDRIELNNENIVNLAQRSPQEVISLLKIVGLNCDSNILSRLHVKKELEEIDFVESLYEGQNLQTYKDGVCPWRFGSDFGLSNAFYGLNISTKNLKFLLDKVFCDLKEEIYPALIAHQKKIEYQELQRSDYYEVFGRDVADDLYKICEKPITWMSNLLFELDKFGKDNGECLALLGTFVPKMLELREKYCLEVGRPVSWDDWGMDREDFSNWQDAFYNNFKTIVFPSISGGEQGALGSGGVESAELKEWTDSFKIMIRQLQLNDEYFFKRSGFSKESLFEIGMIGSLGSGDYRLNNKPIENQIKLAFVSMIDSGEASFVEICGGLSIPAGVLFNISMDSSIEKGKSEEDISKCFLMKTVMNSVWEEVAPGYKKKCSKVYEVMKEMGALSSKSVFLNDEKYLAVKEALNLTGALYDGELNRLVEDGVAVKKRNGL